MSVQDICETHYHENMQSISIEIPLKHENMKIVKTKFSLKQFILQDICMFRQNKKYTYISLNAIESIIKICM